MVHPVTGLRRAVADISIQELVSRGPITPGGRLIHNRKFVQDRKFVHGKMVVHDRKSVPDRVGELTSGTSRRSGLNAGLTDGVKESPTVRGFTPFRIFPSSKGGER